MRGNCLVLTKYISLISAALPNTYAQPLSRRMNVRHNWKLFVQHEGTILLITLVIVRLTLNVIVRQMPLDVLLRKLRRGVLEFDTSF